MLNKITNICRLLYWMVKLVKAIFELAVAIYIFFDFVQFYHRLSNYIQHTYSLLSYTALIFSKARYIQEDLH